MVDPIRIAAGRESFLPRVVRERCGPRPRGAEIGVERGHFAKALLERVPGLTLTCVDAWRAYRGYREHVTQAKLDAFHDETRRRLAPFGDRVIIVRAWSVDAARQHADGSLDFVYVDANHAREQVAADIAAWAPKVRAGGIVAGHDYCRRGNMDYGVIEAVNAYVEARGVALHLLVHDKSPSWLWIAP